MSSRARRKQIKRQRDDQGRWVQQLVIPAMRDQHGPREAYRRRFEQRIRAYVQIYEMAERVRVDLVDLDSYWQVHFRVSDVGQEPDYAFGRALFEAEAREAPGGRMDAALFLWQEAWKHFHAAGLRGFEHSFGLPPLALGQDGSIRLARPGDVVIGLSPNPGQGRNELELVCDLYSEQQQRVEATRRAGRLSASGWINEYQGRFAAEEIRDRASSGRPQGSFAQGALPTDGGQFLHPMMRCQPPDGLPVEVDPEIEDRRWWRDMERPQPCAMPTRAEETAPEDPALRERNSFLRMIEEYLWRKPVTEPRYRRLFEEGGPRAVAGFGLTLEQRACHNGTAYPGLEVPREVVAGPIFHRSPELEIAMRYAQARPELASWTAEFEARRI